MVIVFYFTVFIIRGTQVSVSFKQKRRTGFNQILKKIVLSYTSCGTGMQGTVLTLCGCVQQPEVGEIGPLFIITI